MRKLADVKDGEALDLWADLLDPIVEISSDPAFKEMTKDGKHTRLEIVQFAIRNHKDAIMKALAVLEGVPVEEYHCDGLTLPVTLLELINDPEVIKLFT
jgi:hypothetical protein